MKALEEGTDLQLDFTKLQKIAKTDSQVVPVVVQDADSHEVLVVAYANQKALDHTLATGTATFWSTLLAQRAFWIKGATSGDTLQIVDIRKRKTASRTRCSTSPSSAHAGRRSSATRRTSARSHTRKTWRTIVR